MMAALKALVVPILLGVVVVGCSSPRESTSGLPTVDVAAAGDTRADWPAAVADGALLARQQPLPVEVGVVVFSEGIRNPDARDARDKLRSVETPCGGLPARYPNRVWPLGSGACTPQRQPLRRPDGLR